MLVDGEPRVACVTPIVARRGPRRSRRSKVSTPSARDRSRGRVRRDRWIAVRVLHARHRHAVRGRARPRRRPRAGRAPVPLHGLADGATTRSRRRCRRDGHASARDLEPRRGARSWRAASRSTSAPTFRSAARISPTTPRRATRSSRCRSRRARRPKRSTRPGCDWVVGESLLEARARGRQGAGPAHDRRRAAAAARRARRRARPAACGSRPRGSSPRTSSPTRRGASRAVSPRRRSSTAARSAASCTRPRRAPRASSPIASARRCASSTRARTSCGSGPKRPPIAATARLRATATSRSTAWSRRRRGRVRGPWPTPYGVAVRARWREVDVAGSAGRAPICARSASPSRPCWSKARSTQPASTARRSRRPDVARHLRAGAVGRERGARCSSIRRRAPRADRGSRRGRRSARRDRAALLRDRRRAHGAWAGSVPSRWRSTRRPERCTTSRSGRSASCAPTDMPPDRRDDRRRRRDRSRAVDRRGVRRGRGRHVERVARGTRPDTFPTRHVCLAPTQEVDDARRSRSHAERAAGGRARTRRRCAPATGSCSPARSGSIPRPARMVDGGVEAQARQVLANIAAVLGDCGATITDVAKTTVFVTDIGAVRGPSTRSTPKRSATTARPARPCRWPRSPPAPKSRSKSGPTSP